MNLCAFNKLVSELDAEGAHALRDALKDAASSAMMELMLVDTDERSVDRRRLIAGNLASALSEDLKGAA